MNYNSLINKPTLNHKELIGNNSTSDIGGMTEEQFTTLLETDLTSYYTKAQIDELFSRSYVYREKSGSIVTFDCPETTNGISEVTSEIVAVQSGSGDPSPTNVRPISGWSAVNVLDRGKNLFVTTTSSGTAGGVIYTVNDDGSITVSGTATAGTAYAIGRARVSSAMGKVTISAIGTATNISYNSITLHDQSDTLLATITSGSTQATFTFDLSTYPTAYSIKISVKRRDNGACSGVLKPQVEIGESATAFVPFNGQTYTTALKDGQSNPLTCYGGELENVNGVQSLTVNKKLRIFTGASSENWNYTDTYNRVFINIPDAYKPAQQLFVGIQSNIIKSGRDPETYSGYINDQRNLVIYAPSEITSANDWKTWLQNGNDLQVVYTLATSVEIPQDNLSIASSEGVNNIWCDTGDITVKALDKIIQG